MPSQPNFYAVLGVAPNSDDVVIRAAFKALMLKYHPDTNKSSDATQRAAEINAAYQVIGNPEKRAIYDAWLTNASARQAPPPPPPPPPPPTDHRNSTPPSSGSTNAKISRFSKLPSAILLTLSFSLLLLIIFNLENDTTYTDITSAGATDEATPQEITDNYRFDPIPLENTPETSIYNQQFLMPKSLPFTGPSINFEDIENVVYTFDRIIMNNGIIGVREWSESCHSKARDQRTWEALDNCAAFDFAAVEMDTMVAKSAALPPSGYFVFQGANQTDYYTELGGMPYEVEKRLAKIKAAVSTALYDAVASRASRNEDLRSKGEANEVGTTFSE